MFHQGPAILCKVSSQSGNINRADQKNNNFLKNSIHFQRHFKILNNVTIRVRYRSAIVTRFSTDLQLGAASPHANSFVIVFRTVTRDINPRAGNGISSVIYQNIVSHFCRVVGGIESQFRKSDLLCFDRLR